MKGGALRPLLCVALLLMVPLASADHASHLGQVTSPHVSPHGHGPFSPCPPAHAPCVACASAGLFAPPPAVVPLALPAESAELAAPVPFLVSRRAPARALGRSPPAS